MKFIAIASATLFAAVCTRAAPTMGPGQTLIVSPHITAPEQDDFWAKGSRQVVRWDTNKIPRDKVIANGLVVLGYSVPGSDDENLDLDNPLACDFSLADGEVEVDIPVNVDPRKDYFIVLFGDSGNVSP